MMWFEKSFGKRRKNNVSWAGSQAARWILSAVLIFAAAQPLQAQGVLDYLPEDALGFVLVRDVTRASEKCEQLNQLFDLPLPAPMAFVKFSTKLGEGIDFDGDVLISLIPGSQAASAPEPLVLLPIADYRKFAASVQGDGSGEVSRATIVGENVLVARHGPYAMVMNIESRETLEILTALEPQQVALIRPLNDWMQQNIVTVGIMPTGMKRLLELDRQNRVNQQEALGDDLDNLEFFEPPEQPASKLSRLPDLA